MRRPTAPPHDLALAIRGLRETLNLSQRGLAFHMGVAPRTVQHWEVSERPPRQHVLLHLRAELRARPGWRERVHQCQDVEQLLLDVGLLDKC